MSTTNTSVFDWIEERFDPQICTSEEFIYDEMESQSGFSLPIIYQPFDSREKWHWADRGSAYDFLYSTQGEGKRLLDFGPGDGWPSLLVAPYVKEVVGLDASKRRVEVCSQNAERLGIENARFVSYDPGTNLPFDDNSFDGVMAASAVEQTPNPKEILEEFYRVLKPGGRLRISYEALNRYKGGKERDIWIAGLGEEVTKIILYNRKIEEEYVIQYGLTAAISKEEIEGQLLDKDGQVDFDQLLPYLEKIESKITNVQSTKTVHPSGRTYIDWLEDIGFSKVKSTHNGNAAAWKLYEQYSDQDRPDNLEAVNQAVKKVVKVAIELEAPVELDKRITAVK